MKIISWNVNGLRAILKKGDLQKLIEVEQPDILCLQETKAKQGQAEVDFADYEEIWNSAERAGYSGTAIFSKQKPLNVSFKMFEAQGWSEAGDAQWVDGFGDARKEGRVLTAEFEDFYLVDTYVPNAKAELERLNYRERVWDPAMLSYLQELEKTKPVIICGDFNVAHEEIDLARPKQNTRSAGFTAEERKGMDNYLAGGLVDIWRELHPDEAKYSWWSYRGQARKNNVGWRIDYFLISEGLRERVAGAEIMNEVVGSDHCPVSLELKDE